MKKFLALLLALIMALSLVACGGSNEEPAPTDEGEATEVVVPEGRIKVMYWSPYTGTSADFVDEIINEFNTMQDTYFVVREFNGGYYDQIAKLMATEKKDLPALCNSSSETVGSYLHSGLIKNVQDYIDADPSYNTKLYGNLLATYGVDGKLVGYPIGMSLSGFWYNKAIFAAAGIDPASLTSFDRVYDAALKICEGGYAKYAIAEEHSGIWANYAFAREGFYCTDNDNGSTGLPTKCLYDDNSNGFADVVTNYYTKWADLANKGYVYTIGAKIKDELIPAMAAGDLAMIVTTNSYRNRVVDAFGTGDCSGFGFIPMFSATDNGKQTGYCSSGNGCFIVDNGDADAMQGAWEYIKYFTSVDVQLRWNTQTGYLPMYDEIMNDASYQEFLKTDDFTANLIAALQNSDSSAYYAFTATNNEYTTPGATCLEAVCNGTPVDQAISDMCATINDAFTMYNATNK